jgi:hypothetical protein
MFLLDSGLHSACMLPTLPRRQLLRVMWIMQPPPPPPLVTAVCQQRAVGRQLGLPVLAWMPREQQAPPSQSLVLEASLARRLSPSSSSSFCAAES